MQFKLRYLSLWYWAVRLAWQRLWKKITTPRVEQVDHSRVMRQNDDDLREMGLVEYRTLTHEDVVAIQSRMKKRP